MIACVGVSADESVTLTLTLPEEYEQMLRGLPETLRDSLPERLFTSDAQTAADAFQALLSPRSLLDCLLAGLREQSGLLRLFAGLCGVLLLRSIVGHLTSSLHSPTLAEGVKLLSRVVLFGIVVAGVLSQLEGVQAFFGDLRTLTTAFLPLMGSMYALGGNVGAAAVNHSLLILSLSLVEWVGSKTIVPLFSLCLVFSILGVFGTFTTGRGATLSAKLKKWYTTALSLTMLLLMATLSAQTTLAARADSWGMRTARFALSSSVPVIGGGLSDMLRTAATGVSWLRGVVGLGGVALLLWLLLPQVITLFLTRTVYSLAGDVAAWLGCEEEGKLLSEIAGLFGYMIAVALLCVMTFFISLLLLLKCGAAFGG
jgi:stage III sporulation protein AE